MDIYKKRSYWNILLALFGLLILIVTLVYSNFLAQKLKKREDNYTVIYIESLKELSNPSLSTKELAQDVNLNDYIISAYQLPVIFEDETGALEGANWGKEKNMDVAFLKMKKNEFLKTDKEAIKGFGYIKKIYYFNSSLIQYIKYYPYVQILLVGSFVLLGYYFLRGSKRSEQNRIWAGMAKETAHQLGTPISAIIAWIEHLKLTNIDEEQTEIVHELRNDVNRLELVADRFSKIGSEPILTAVNIYEEMDSCRIYMERRASRNVVFHYPDPTTGNLQVKINKHLFDWVIENLIRNSLDAMDGKGTLTAEIKKIGNFVNIDMTDTGKGIPSAKHQTIFEPGFTTKKRGWGLGLSLAKRIVENYHKGRIFVKSSKPNRGTTFTIKLPIVIN